MKAITNTTLILENRLVWDGVLLFEGDRIVACGPADELAVPDHAARIDAGGLYTAPGLIDIHNHGGNDRWFWQDPIHCCEHFIRHGQTTILPTLYATLTYEQILEAFARIRQASQSGVGRIMDGIYMEGPYMNADIGSHQSSMAFRGPIKEEEYHSLLEAAGDLVRVWCIDPARPGIEGFMQAAKAAQPQVIFSLGHSVASPEQCRKLKKYGIRNQTHHSNIGVPPGQARGTHGVGPDEAALLDPDIYTELISDRRGIHVRPENLLLVTRIKGTDRVILITDATGTEATSRPGPGIAYGEDLSYDDEGHLAGSRLTLDAACRNMMQHTGLGLCQVIQFASLNPARMLGIDDRVGSLEAGKQANLILIDDRVRVKRVILAGQTVHTA